MLPTILTARAMMRVVFIEPMPEAVKQSSRNSGEAVIVPAFAAMMAPQLFVLG